jgi:glycosyltransferase involved in cell wall biosynthesis
MLENHTGTINPLVSIIIPVYNRAHTIEACLRSCTRQTYSNIEIIVVDDGSTDNSVVLVKAMMQHDARIRLSVNPKNMKLGYTRNAGIRMATGQYITFLDSDDEFLFTKIEICMQAFSATGADCIVPPVISRFHNRADEVSHVKPSADILKDYLLRKVVWKIIGPVWSRSCLNAIGWFVEGEAIFGSEDFEFHTRAILKKVKFHFLDEALSIQINLDPTQDTVKIRDPKKFESSVRVKIYSRAAVLRNIVKADIPFRQKLRYVRLILRYLLAILKRALPKVGFVKFVMLPFYMFWSILFASTKPVGPNHSTA